MSVFKFFKFFLVILSLSALLSGCSSLPKLKKPDWSKGAIEPDGRKRAQNNVKDGKGIRLFKSKKGEGNFMFASSNPMWKASLDTLSFVSLSNTDYSGGVLITDWYSEGNPDQAIKITIRFLSNEIRSDGLIIKLYKRNCIKNVCSTVELKNDLVVDIRKKILERAAIYQEQKDRNIKTSAPEVTYKGDNN
jgi:hypothetical protein|tara:strand:+ start:1070 stop:1642 length:573 start_codon:yes stop_codon:yes gene_type:complete